MRAPKLSAAWLGAVLLAHAATAVAASAEPQEPWAPACERVRERDAPESDRPTAAEAKALTNCSSEALLYGIGQPPDPRRARLCAFAEGDATNAFTGPAILMTIYATGAGVPRNPELALHYACELDGAWAEMDGRVRHLEGLARTPGKTVAFDVCDDITSGAMMGECARHQQRVAAAARDQRYQKMMTGWSPPAREAFTALRRAAQAFFEARAGNEVDLGGTGRGAFEVEENERLEASFAALLDLLGRGALPAATPAALAKADRRLNSVYKIVIRAPPAADGSVSEGMTVTANGIRDAERTWPAYRDAWADFAKLAFPRVAPTSVKAFLTNARADLLDELAPRPARR